MEPSDRYGSRGWASPFLDQECLKRVAFILIAALAVSACAVAARPSQTEPLLVAAAASLETAFSELGAAYTDQTGQAVEFAFGSSGNLATQIQNGAPFDVYASADEAYVDQLVTQGYVLPETQAVYAQGKLVLVVNIASDLQVGSIEDLADARISRVAIANPDVAPYGMAAKQVLEASGLWDMVAPKIVQGANVRQALQYVQTGDAPVGLVALSIADVPEVRYTVVDASLYEPLNQAIAVVSSTDRESTARSFVDFVLGSAGQAILAKHGFTTPGSP